MKIKFIPASESTPLTVDPPVPARKVIPEWYSKIPRFQGNNGPEFEDGMVSNNTLKACYPFYDAITGGYVQKTWCDIHFNFGYEDSKLVDVKYNYSSIPEPCSTRKDTNILFSDEEYHPIEFVWRMPYLPVLPDGWSMLMVSPLNRFDLPFTDTSGIIDSDKFYHIFYGQYPFYVKKYFNNKILPAGTPMYQMIPIKRERWDSKIEEISEKERYLLTKRLKVNFISTYKKFFYQKKEYY